MFTRCAVLMPEGADTEQAHNAVRAVVGAGGWITLIGWHRPGFWHLGDIWSGVDADVRRAEDALSAFADTLTEAGYRTRCSLELSTDAPIDSVPDDVELVIIVAADSAVSDDARVWTERILDAGRAVAWARGDAPPVHDTAAVHAAVAYMGGARRALPAVATLREHARGQERLSLVNVGLGDRPTAADDELRHLVGWPGPLSLHTLSVPMSRLVGELDGWLTDNGVNILSVPVPAAGMARGLLLRALAGLLRPMPVLWVPDPGDAPDAAVIDGPDLVRTGPTLIARLDTVDAFGTASPLDARRIEVIVGGAVVGDAQIEAGRMVMPPLPESEGEPQVIGFSESGQGLARLRAAVRIVEPGGRIAVFDAAAPIDPTATAAFDPPGVERRWWAVRLDGRVPCRSLRQRLARCGPDALLDAAAVLDDGDPDDLPTRVGQVRLARVVRRLRAAGFKVDVALDAAPVPGVATPSLATWQAMTTHQRRELHRARPAIPSSLDDPDPMMLVLTDAPRTTATRVHVELDNAAARRRLIGLIDGAIRSILLQIYIFEADHVGEAVVDALAAAGDRGVTVRVLVDALFSQHRAMGQTNPTLARLDVHPAVELRIIRPFGVPGLDDLKRRDHRKLLIVDDAIGWVTGRNIGGAYYTAFDEVTLTPESNYRDVPWLDAGAEVEGPIVADMAAAFARHWAAAGGGPITPSPPRSAGHIPVRLVLHESMRDARTLDAYLRLIARARRQIIVCNTFPLQFELQRALLDALARGVRVRFLIGHVRPLFGPDRTPFKGGALRSLATEVIHGRLDRLIAAGAEARGHVVARSDGWSTQLAPILPHVHAKLLTVDSEVFAIGSANLDITAGYWESEALLIVEDAEQTAQLDAQLDVYLKRAVPIDAEPGWSDSAARRVWVSRNWPSVLG